MDNLQKPSSHIIRDPKSPCISFTAPSSPFFLCLAIMASSSSSFSPPLPINNPIGGFDVFISFRGRDTRNGFTSHLHAALRGKHILSFIDSKHLRAGDHISDSLFQAIVQSKLYIVVFSPNYASSKWCLLELIKILHEKRMNGKMVMPVFYKVVPSVLRYQTGTFGVAFSKHQQRQGTETVQIWKDALAEASHLSGYDSSSIRPESKLIERIVEDVLEKLERISSVHFKGLIGIDLRIKEVKSLLCDESVNKVGLWGMGGIGKTTVAKSVFLSLYTQFHRSCFLENIGEELKRNGQVASIWKKLVREMFVEKSFNTGTSTLGLEIMMERLYGAKVLVVFDDVDESILTELQDLLDVDNGVFGKGSKILITSRNKQVLTILVDKIYQVEGLNYDEGLRLFSQNAFKKHYPPNDYVEMSRKILHYARGNPLALKVLGASLLKRDKSYWNRALQKLEQIPKPKVMDALKVSFDGLSPEEQAIFLDIAFGLRGEDKEVATKILNSSSYYYSMELIITSLLDKCLITIAQPNHLEMHDLLQEMGWYIVRQESPNPEERSRLQDAADVYDVLTKKKGTRKIQSIVLNLFEARTMYLEGEAFVGMDNLRFLKIFGRGNKVHFRHGGLQFLPGALRYIYWEAFPLQSLTFMSSLEHLVILQLPKSKVERLWRGKQHLVNLRLLDLRYCKNLAEIPDLSKAKNIKSIDLSNCGNLVMLHPSVQYLNKLQMLHLHGCRKLRNLPQRFDSKCLVSLLLRGCSNIEKFPNLLGTNLEMLSLNDGCLVREVPPLENFKRLKYLKVISCSDMVKFPDFSSCILWLKLSGTGIQEIPFSVQSLTGLYFLDLSDNKCLSTLPVTISKMKSLQYLYLRHCPKLEEFPEILEPMEHLAELHLSYCENLQRLPNDISNLISLRKLNLRNCKVIRFVPKTPPSLRYLYVDNCESLETLLSSDNDICCFRELSFVNCCRLDEKTQEKVMAMAESRTKGSPHRLPFQVCLPGSEIPEWFNIRSLGSSGTVPLPFNYTSNSVLGITFCIVYQCSSSSEEHRSINVRLNCYAKDNNTLVQRQCSLVYLPSYAAKSDHVVLYHPPTEEFNDYFPAEDVLPDFSGLSLEFWSELGDDDIMVKDCVVHLILAEDSDSNDEGYFSCNDEELTSTGCNL